MTRTISAAGAMIMWDVQCDFDRDRLCRNLDLCGFAKYTPHVKTNETALETSLKSIMKSSSVDFVVGALEQRSLGFDVSLVQRGKTQNTHQSIFTASVDDGVVTITKTADSQFDADWLSNEVQRQYDLNKTQTSGPAVTSCLVKILNDLSCLRLRRAGGAYYIPEHSLRVWTNVEGAVRDAASAPRKVRFDLITVGADERGFRTIKENLTEEVRKKATELLGEIASGRLRSDGLATRRDAAVALREKVARYGDILGEALKELDDVCAVCEESAVSAGLQMLKPLD